MAADAGAIGEFDACDGTVSTFLDPRDTTFSTEAVGLTIVANREIEELTGKHGMGVALVGSPEWTILGYFVGAGFATGLYFACTPHLLAELYGKARLGSARAAVQCVTLVCSAASTIGLGVWTDAGLSISIVLVAGIVVIAVTSLIALLASH